ncbi:HEPN domain-containing protein [Flammeovirga sp. OC4]|uniref:HEPN domain-containing protein n=1 Tax=Flammeovirga sp. OC4 TaxID=1382345 RepID=UPI0005C70002|nr:HEPN domain-containing protein [Flammeovirga sp. OC4]
MKKIYWFTHLNLASTERLNLTFDLTKYLKIFIENEIWNKAPYRIEYTESFKREDIEKINSIKIHIHTEHAPYSNFHNYEEVLNKYIDLHKIESSKILLSGISEANKLAVVDVDFESSNKVKDTLSYEDEKDIDKVFERMGDDDMDFHIELLKIKSVISEFIQFFMFNLHLNFLTHDYQFSFADKPELIGFTVVSENNKQLYKSDKIDLLSHYILYEGNNDNLLKLMDTTSLFWHKNIPSIHFFLDALKGNNVTSTNFIKMVFTLESFFGKNVSNDFVTLTIPMILSKNIRTSKSIREKIKKCFDRRNEIVHGNNHYNLNSYSDKKGREVASLFFELKNIITYIFYFYIQNNFYHSKQNEKINHEMIFNLLPNGIGE